MEFLNILKTTYRKYHPDENSNHAEEAVEISKSLNGAKESIGKLFEAVGDQYFYETNNAKVIVDCHFYDKLLIRYPTKDADDSVNDKKRPTDVVVMIDDDNDNVNF
jgi:hypothetical protein